MRIFLLFLSFVLILAPLPSAVPVQAAVPETYCRFSIGAANGVYGYDLTLLGVGSYLDWRSVRAPIVPATIRFLHMISVSDRNYAVNLTNLPTRLATYPGAIWIIGNEPDSEVTYQDHITAEVYAQRFFELTSIIRSTDSTAMIGFGPVIMPTAVRQHYLELALARLDQLSGSRTATRALIDIFTIHNFILNEHPIYVNGQTVSWGAGVPLGYDESWPPYETIRIDGEVNETWKTHDIATFSQRVINFRQWMTNQGFRDRPLWITEYGSLFPSVGNLYLTVSDQDTADFMQQTFDFMLSTTNDQIGYPGDGNRLVQHFVWYSLNDDRTHFGGSLYDPDTHSLTLVGERFIQYDPPAGSLPTQPADLTIVQSSLRVMPISISANPDLANYRVYVRATNLIASEYRTTIQIKLFDNGQLVGQQTGVLPRCAGHTEFAFIINDLLPGSQHTFSAQVILVGGNGPENNPANDQYAFPAMLLPKMYRMLLPIAN